MSNPLGECARLTTIGLIPSEDASAHERGAQLAVDLLNERASFSYELDVPGGDPNDAVRGFIASPASAVIGEPTRSQADFLQNGGLTTLALGEEEVVNSVGNAIFRLALTDIETVAEATRGVRVLEDLPELVILAAGDVPARFAERSFEDVALATDDPGSAASARPDVIALVSTPNAAQGAVDGLADEDFRGVTVIGPSSSEARTAALPGTTFMSTPWDAASPLPLSEEFVTRFEDEYGQKPGIDSTYAYSAVILIARAVEEACSNDRTELRAEMARTRGASTLMGRFTFTRNGAPRHPVMVFEVRAGGLVPVGLTPG